MSGPAHPSPKTLHQKLRAAQEAIAAGRLGAVDSDRHITADMDELDIDEMNDFCPSCDATDKPFRLIQRVTEQEFRGETLRVTSPALQCRHCSFGLLGPGHLDALRLATHDTYRRLHGLLTSGEIAARRKAMGLSQKRFAEYLGVGSASIERWEAGTHVQDKASDLLLRQRSDRGLYFNLRPAGRSTRTFAFSLPGSPAMI